ncbi:hypothetical protein H6P81_004549 [Aristolochia fimbriata]|uniref:Uncharacterized protein n=1 Tax=Aristolochia fimbriata TaxID=158543 RepID=A0AAV7FGQ0_ARIFI|nr:hypothetical protein H6P81_004549 [Aristolochia fimbriata]
MRRRRRYWWSGYRKLIGGGGEEDEDEDEDDEEEELAGSAAWWRRQSGARVMKRGKLLKGRGKRWGGLRSVWGRRRRIKLNWRRAFAVAGMNINVQARKNMSAIYTEILNKMGVVLGDDTNDHKDDTYPIPTIFFSSHWGLPVLNYINPCNARHVFPAQGRAI